MTTQVTIDQFSQFGLLTLAEIAIGNSKVKKIIFAIVTLLYVISVSSFASVMIVTPETGKTNFNQLMRRLMAMQ